MNSNQHEIPVFFAIDDAYAPYLGVALCSMKDKISSKNNYRVIILCTELSEDNISKLSKLESENFKIDFVTMRGGLETIQDRMSNRIRCDYFTLTIYFRIFIPVMFPQYDKGIYVDSDTVFNTDIAELFNIDIADNYIGACSDISIMDTPPLVNYAENAVGVPMKQYINSGVLLMNLKKLREVQFEARFLNLLNTYHFDSIAPDQDYINAMCNGKILYLDSAWDAMPNADREPLKNPKIVHYNLFSKPWCYDNVQYGDYFWKYAKDSAFYNEIVFFKDNFGESKQKAERKCLDLIISRGVEIADSDITFKKMFENGVEIRLC